MWDPSRIMIVIIPDEHTVAAKSTNSVGGFIIFSGASMAAGECEEVKKFEE